MVRLPRQTVSFFAAFFCALALSSCAGIPGESKSLYREFYSLGQEYESVKNYDRAISCYEKACQDKTLYDSAYYRIGLCAVQQKKWNLAEEVPAIPKQKIKRQSAITAKDPIRRVFVILFMATYYTFF